MHTRRKFLVTGGSALASALIARSGAAEKKPVLSFGLMADCQYADADTRGTRFYRESPRKLEEAVAALNRRDLAFSFHLGDFIDRDFKSFETLAPITAKLRSKLYHALGNHDFDVADDLKARVPAKLGLEEGYYSFRRDGFRFVVIDTTDVSVYRHPEGAEERRLAEDEMAELQASGSAAAKPWNGRPGEKQIAWLRQELEAATLAKETILVFGHHPVLPEAGHSMWNSAALDRLLQEHPCAKLYVNGHNHAGAYTDSKGLHYLTLDGMLETEKENAFAFADLYPDRLEITGFGRQESHTLRFR